MLALVKNWENQKPRRPDPPWKLLGLGLLFVNGMAALFLPVGLFGTVFSTISFLGLLFLPLFFLTLKLTKFYGNTIFFALFLGFLSGPLSALYLSHAFGFFLGLQTPEQTILQADSGILSSRIFRFTNSKFLYKYQLLKTAILKTKAPGSITKPLYFHVAPWVANDWKEGEQVHVWAACPQLSEKVCDWEKQNPRVGESLSASGLYSYYSEAVQDAGKKYGFAVPQSPKILLPISNPEGVLVNMGILGISGLLVLNYLWIIGVIIWRRRLSNS
ncbi:hypothetical protein EHO59_08095 [Leptospira semungkisensis]|uniref:Uncharacterized protein n=1 Tax=Leptospira semungkisensis TaxID=2484985 RepID=A0A4R9G0A3_9LEPT|nr:hypothetical protein [Leptospira semungkisensis]TGK04808.1 hypothetical protein EHO59_08095 [Leptospira semungkisensis]